MEKLIQQKLDGLRMEPTEADWQAIYDRLHPRKKRRFIWWWLPLGTGLLAVAIWLAAPTGQSPLPGQDASVHTPQGTTNAQDNVEAPSSSNVSPLSAPGTASKHSTAAPVTGRDDNAGNKNLVSRADASTGRTVPPVFQSASEESKNTPALRETGNTSSPIDTEPTSDIAANEPHTVAAAEAAPVINTTERSVEELPEQQGRIVDTTEQLQTPDSAIVLTKDSPDSAAIKNIPVKSESPVTGWRWGFYGGIGLLHPTSAIYATKSAPDNSFPGASGSSNRIELAHRNGVHGNAGLVLEKRGRKFSFSTGIGMQYDHWSTDLDIYRDSMASGGMSTTLLSSNDFGYSMFGLELPLNFAFRIAGSEKNSFWIAPGFNNFFAFSLTEKLTSATGGTGSFTGNATNSLNSRLAKYQPQVRLGLIYESGDRWQVSPMVQYGLTPVAISGEPELNMLHFQLQFRYFLMRKVR